MMKRRFFYNHPILGGLIALGIATLICNGIGMAAFLVKAMADLVEAAKSGVIANVDEAVAMLGTLFDSEANSTLFNGSVIVAAFLCLPVFSWLNRKNGFLGFCGCRAGT